MQRPDRILVIAVLAALLSGCATESSPDISPTPTFSSETDAFAAAEATYRAYVDALNQVDLADPATFEAVYAWSTGELNARDRRNLSQMHAGRQTVSGESVVASIDLASVDESARRVEVAVCVDVSSVDVKDLNGTSTVSPDRVDIQSISVELVVVASTDTGMAISSIFGREGEPGC